MFGSQHSFTPLLYHSCGINFLKLSLYIINVNLDMDEELYPNRLWIPRAWQETDTP